jgi:hypothetical protein
MALIFKTQEELGHYQKIRLEGIFINKDGMYVETIVFKDIQNRELDKSRVPFFSTFLEQIKNKNLEMLTLPDGLKFEDYDGYTEQDIDKVPQIIIDRNNFFNEFHKAIYVLENFEKAVYQIEGQPRLELTEEFLLEAEKYGFIREWYTNPVIIIRTDIIRVGDYNKPDFDLPTFYNLLKQNIYTKEDGTIIVEDDL